MKTITAEIQEIARELKAACADYCDGKTRASVRGVTISDLLTANFFGIGEEMGNWPNWEGREWLDAAEAFYFDINWNPEAYDPEDDNECED